MKILFIGTVEFSLKILEKLIDINANIIGACTKKESSFNKDFADITPLCTENGIPYKHVNDINSQESLDWIRKKNPDIIFCFGWSSLIKTALLNLTPMGVVGYHPASLPLNRGRHPIIWTLVLGLSKSASTFFFMNEDADNGDIISQVEFDISYEDDANVLYKKIINIALDQIEILLPKLQNNTFTRSRQDSALSNSWRKRSFKDGIIDFRMSSNAIYNLVRGLSKPYMGATLVFKNVNIPVWKVEIVKLVKQNIEPGKVIDAKDNSILVKTYDSAIWIVEHEFKSLPNVGEYL